MKVLALALALSATAQVAATAPLAPRTQIEAAVAEAASAFRLPPSWIFQVMARESGGRSAVVSPAGAMGLMQLMPSTWAELRIRLGLGADPFDVHDNVLAGAAYLRELFDRFGAPGFLAAYNAGPDRYADFVAGRTHLPAETRRYVAVLAPTIGSSIGELANRERASLAPNDAGLFPFAQPRRR